jgi:acyl-CoA thioester hydrolase
MDQGAALEVWRGCVNSWECDELGHLNMRFYLARAVDGLARLAAALGQPHAFAASATATLKITRQHVRFFAEAQAGAPLRMTAGLTALQDDGAEVLQVLYHSDGRAAASVISQLQHATPHGRAFPWPVRTHDAVDSLTVAIPDFAAPRNFTGQEPVDPAEASAKGLTTICLAPVTARDCDVFGYMSPDTALGLVSDGMNYLTAPIYAVLAEVEPGLKLSTAAVEYRIDHLERPRAGDLVEVRSRLVGLADKVIQVEHWLCDPVSRRVWARARGVHANFDLEARRARSFPAEVRARFPSI